MRQPGIEPGPTAWKAAILTFRLLSQLIILLFIKVYKVIFYTILFVYFLIKRKKYLIQKIKIIYLLINLIKQI